MRIEIKPFSFNEAYKGRQRKSEKYKAYETLLLLKLPPLRLPEGRLLIIIKFGFNNSGSDLDNPQKAFFDVLQKKYKFNDNKIYQIVATKILVKKPSKEFIDFVILDYEKYFTTINSKP